MKRLVGTLCLCFVFACGGSQQSSKAFDKGWQSDSGASIAKLEQQLRSAKRVSNAPVAIGVTDKGIIGIGLDGSGRWAGQGSVDVLPIVTGNIVVTSGSGELTARDAKSGKTLWKQPTGRRSLRGAADDGTLTAVVLGAEAARSRVLTITREGEVLLDIETEETVGRPATLGGYVFLPWASQFVSVLDMRSGAEVARLLLREQVSHALNFDGDVYFGELGLTRFDERIRFAMTQQANHLRLPMRELPGKPMWLGSGNEADQVSVTARTKIRSYARPSMQGGKLGFASNGFAASYFRVVYGLSEKDASLRWVRALPNDVVGGAAASSGFAFCGSDGKIWLISADGGDAGHAELGDRVKLCTISTGPAPLAPKKLEVSLAQQLASAFEVLEPDMAVAQRFLLTELGKLKEPLVSKLLIELSSSPRLPPDQRDETRRLLAARRNGAEYMLQALERHYDFVSGVILPPPVGPLAEALSAMGEKAAAPLLARHLNDPANSPEDVLQAALALRALAGAEQFEELRTFFALYRATADSDELVKAVIAVGAALVRIGSESGRELVVRAAEDPLTHPEVRRALTALVPAPKNASADVGDRTAKPAP